MWGTAGGWICVLDLVIVKSKVKKQMPEGEGGNIDMEGNHRLMKRLKNGELREETFPLFSHFHFPREAPSQKQHKVHPSKEFTVTLLYFGTLLYFEGDKLPV